MFQGRKFVVIGLGKSGIGAAKLLLARGAHVVAINDYNGLTAGAAHRRAQAAR
jgi:UDP-N-acetylmuramoylalanine-D-glutamate ligase